MRFRSLCALALAALLASVSLADTIRLRDGRVLEGTIVSETRSRVVFDARISSITTRMTFRRSEIESIEKGELAEKAETPQKRPARRDTRPEPARPTRADEPRTEYLVVPIRGVFGEQVGPQGVRDVINHAMRRDIEHIVFEIDSPGGQVWAAEEISTVMSERPASLKCYALIDDAISAAIWVALGCDEIFIRPDGTIGGAVAYSQNYSTGAVEVDAKLNSILAAKLEGVSSRNGHAPEIARAMVVYEDSLYAERDDDGSYRFSNNRLPDAEKLDDENTVLTLTGAQVAEYGLGAIFAGEHDALGDTLGLEGWRLANDYGAAAMRRGQRSLRDRAQLFEDRAELYLEFNLLIERINQTNPDTGGYRIHEGGAMTSPSIRLWRERTDLCIAACQELAGVIKKLDRVAAKARRKGIEDFIDREDIAEWRRDVDNYIAQLRSNRNKTTF